MAVLIAFRRSGRSKVTTAMRRPEASRTSARRSSSAMVHQFGSVMGAA